MDADYPNTGVNLACRFTPWLYDPNIEDVFCRFPRQAGLDPGTLTIIDTGSPHLEIEAAVAGYGLSISTEVIIRSHLADGRLVLIDTPVNMTSTYFAVSRKGVLPDRHCQVV